jgi:hypothetical protein
MSAEVSTLQMQVVLMSRKSFQDRNSALTDISESAGSDFSCSVPTFPRVIPQNQGCLHVNQADKTMVRQNIPIPK